MKIIIISILIVLTTTTTFAQHHHGEDSNQINHVIACRSGVNYIDGLPAPQLMNGVGSSSLKIKTTSELAQKYFSQGVSQLHCFWDFEAYRSFKEAIRLDPTAVMPYWGILHTILFIDNEEFDEEKKIAVEKLEELSKDAEGYEALYSKGILDFVKTKNPEGYLKQLENVVHTYPNDIDAKLFLALFNMSGYDENMDPNSGNTYSEYILRDLLISNPENHGVQHYWIHQMENCCPEEALESANKLAVLAPQSGHIVHMPGHIYYKLGDYKKAHDQFIKGMQVDSTYMADQQIKEIDNWNYIHNLNYLLANCAQDGRYKEGLQYAERLEKMVVVADRIKMHRGAYFYQGIITPAIMEMRFGFWEKAVKKFDKIVDTDSIYGRQSMDYKNAFSTFSSGMAAINAKDILTARSKLDELDALFWRNSQLENEKERIDKSKLKILMVASAELKGTILIAEKKFDKGIEVLKKAFKMEKDLGYSEPPYYPRPTLLSLADAYIKNRDFENAESSYKKILDKHPNSSIAYWGLMKMHKKLKQKDKYEEVKSKFDMVTQYGDKEVFK
ncbi:MAG: tetratricopeptide (TPR) repeat protein [Psychroserpens sp.]|jgi:tetratricopeptide (TPR) repeat protein